jgi:hypothetical protein|tara:strand:+ start:5706 stop:5996 length:291 start_codon:yes stop_codon:yes gene_type:complete
VQNEQTIIAYLFAALGVVLTSFLGMIKWSLNRQVERVDALEEKLGYIEMHSIKSEELIQLGDRIVQQMESNEKTNKRSIEHLTDRVDGLYHERKGV